MNNRLSDLTQTYEVERRAVACTQFALAADRFITDDPLRYMAARGHKSYETLATKAAVTALSASDTAVALAPLTSALLELALTRSILGRLQGVTTFTLTEFLRMQTASIQGHVVSEAASKPVSTLAFTSAGPAFKAVAQVVGSLEFFRSLDAATQAAITRQLASAAAVALDTEVISALTTAAGAAEASADPGVLLAAIASGNPTTPTLIGDYKALAALAPDLRDLRELGVQIVLSASAAGALFAVDASALAVALENPIVQTAKDALVVMDDGGSPTVTTVLNLFQANAQAIRAEIWARLAIGAGAVSYGVVS